MRLHCAAEVGVHLAKLNYFVLPHRLIDRLTSTLYQTSTSLVYFNPLSFSGGQSFIFHKKREQNSLKFLSSRWSPWAFLMCSCCSDSAPCVATQLRLTHLFLLLLLIMFYCVCKCNSPSGRHRLKSFHRRRDGAGPRDFWESGSLNFTTPSL